MVIDIHTHCFPDFLAAKAIQHLSDKAGIPPHTDGTVTGLRRSMARSGINISVLQPIATKPEQTKTINRWAVSVQGEGITCFGTIHPKFEAWQEEVDFLSSHGIKGVKFHPEYQNFYVDDEGLYPIYDAIFSKGMAIIFHAGADLGFSLPFHCTPDRLRKVVDLFPKANIIAAHMGGYQYWDDVHKYLVGTHVFLDTSYSYESMGRSSMERLINAHGSDKILFGSDSPWGDQSKEVHYIQSLSLSFKNQERIFSKNAEALLK